MSDKKHIDRIFQEKLKDFEASPSPQVWKNIENKINSQKEKTRKTFPVWLKFVGIAALLALFFTIGSVLNNTNDASTTNNVVETDKIIKPSDDTKTNNLNTNSKTSNSGSSIQINNDSKTTLKEVVTNAGESNSNNLNKLENSSKLKDRSNINSTPYATPKNIRITEKTYKENSNLVNKNKTTTNTNHNNVVVGNTDKNGVAQNLSSTKKRVVSNKPNNTNSPVITPKLDKNKAEKVVEGLKKQNY